MLSKKDLYYMNLFYIGFLHIFSEISTLLTEINDLKNELQETQRNVERKEKEILKIHETVTLFA